MTDAVALLHLDHANLTRILDLMDVELTVFNEGGGPDFALLRLILDYVHEYLEECHHPREDVVWRKMVERDPSVRRAVEGILEEHREGTRLTADLAVALDSLELEAEVPRAWFANRARNWIDFNREHAKREEETFLPLAEKLLDEEDWEAVDREVAEREDPVFGERVLGKFEALRRNIVNYAS